MVAWCPFLHIHIVHSSIVIRRDSFPSPHRWSAQWKNLPGVPSRESNSGLPFQQADALPTELRRTLEGIGWVGTEEAGGILDAVQGNRIRINQVSASSSCDYKPPVCGPGPGYIGQRRIVQGTNRPRDASSNNFRSGTHRVGDISS